MKIELTKAQATALWDMAGQMATDDDNLEATVGKRSMPCAKRAYNILGKKLHRAYLIAE